MDTGKQADDCFVMCPWSLSKEHNINTSVTVIMFTYTLSTEYMRTKTCISTNTIEVNITNSQCLLYVLIHKTINYVTWEFGILMSHILPSIRCRWDNALSCDSYSANRTKPKPLDCFVLMSLLTCIQKLNLLKYENKHQSQKALHMCSYKSRYMPLKFKMLP